MRRKYFWYVGIFVAALVFLRFASRQSFATTASRGGRLEAIGQHGGTGGAAEAAPSFNLPLINGGTISLSQFRGSKPVVLDFWASWCPNCRRDMPRLNSLYERYKDQIEVIGINLHEAPVL